MKRLNKSAFAGAFTVAALASVPVYSEETKPADTTKQDAYIQASHKILQLRQKRGLGQSLQQRPYQKLQLRGCENGMLNVDVHAALSLNDHGHHERDCDSSNFLFSK